MFEQTRRFPCPSCRQIIADDAEQCRYCGAPVDKAIAQSAADTQDKVNQACSDASYLRSTAVGMWVLLAISLIFGLVYYGFIAAFFIVIILLVRWQIRFANINTADPDYAKAKRQKNGSLVLWLIALPVGFIVRPLLPLIIAQLFH